MLLETHQPSVSKNFAWDVTFTERAEWLNLETRHSFLPIDPCLPRLDSFFFALGLPPDYDPRRKTMAAFIQALAIQFPRQGATARANVYKALYAALAKSGERRLKLLSKISASNNWKKDFDRSALQTLLSFSSFRVNELQSRCEYQEYKEFSMFGKMKSIDLMLISRLPTVSPLSHVQSMNTSRMVKCLLVP